MRTSKNGVTVGIERFEPERCKLDLAAAGIDTDRWVSGDNAVNYRRLNRKRAEMLALDMRHSSWDLNGETIKYDEDGKLQDGQHRFLASVLSGCSFDSVVVLGVRRISNVDTGGPRRLAHELEHRKIPYPKVVASVVKLIAGHEVGQLRESMGSWGTRATLLDCFEKHKDSLNRFVRETSGCKQRVFVCAAAYIGSRGEWFELSEYFVNGILSGQNLSSDDPVLLIREKLLDAASNRQGVSARVPIFANIIKAWNLLARGEPANSDSLRHRVVGPKREPFPDIVCITKEDWMSKSPSEAG